LLYSILVGYLRPLKSLDIIRIIAKRVPDHFVFTEYFLVEVSDSPQLMFFKEINVICRIESLHVYTDVFQQIKYDLASFIGLCQRL